MSDMRIEELKKLKDRQNGLVSFGVQSPASYFAAAAERENTNNVDGVDGVRADNKVTETKNVDKSHQMTAVKEQQDKMPDNDIGQQKAFIAQEALAIYNKIRLDLT